MGNILKFENYLKESIEDMDNEDMDNEDKREDYKAVFYNNLNGIDWKSDYSAEKHDKIMKDILNIISENVKEGKLKGKLNNEELNYKGFWELSTNSTDFDTISSKITNGVVKNYQPVFSWKATVIKIF